MFLVCMGLCYLLNSYVNFQSVIVHSYYTAIYEAVLLTHGSFSTITQHSTLHHKLICCSSVMLQQLVYRHQLWLVQYCNAAVVGAQTNRAKKLPADAVDYNGPLFHYHKTYYIAQSFSKMSLIMAWLKQVVKSF